jgi:acetyl-CoA carboxylase / biotin carboxylase 1
MESVIPADPADVDSQEQILQKAGQVWFPDSSFKTAQAIKDFNYGEELPLMIFANWRGFSGGQRDMFFEILKFGSYIVDGLTEYKKPIFIYLPPYSELRGGAWVVVDPTINSKMMEFYSDVNARGGILEPTGIVEIKYKNKDISETITRVDYKCLEIKQQIENSSSEGEKKDLGKIKIKKRKIDGKENKRINANIFQYSSTIL